MAIEMLCITAAHKRLVAIGEDAPVIEAAKLLRETNVNLVIVCNHDGAMGGRHHQDGCRPSDLPLPGI